MPIYEYRCGNCRHRTSILVRNLSTFSTPVCSQCGSSELTRLISTFAVLKSEESRLDDMADPSKFGDVDENDPRSVARWMKKMGQEMGEDMGPEFDEMIEKMESGEMPDELAGDDDGGLGGLDDDF